jgi:hypothetical protein
MTALDNERWSREVDAACQRFSDRANTPEWQALPGDLVDDTAEPWGDNADPLDGAYRAGIVPPDQRWASSFTYHPCSPAPAGATILTSRRGVNLTKRIHLDGRIDGYDQAKQFAMRNIHFRNLDDLEIMLQRLLKQPDRCIVRAAIGSGREHEPAARRLLYDRGDSVATLVDVARLWLAVDVDRYPIEEELQRAEQLISAAAGISHRLPRSIAPGDLGGAAWVATSVLPPEFYSADCIVQATGSHALKSGLRVRLWFMLDRAITTAEATYWFRDAPVDPAGFRPAQRIFTAAPLFVDGAVDPVPERLMRVFGRPTVEVPPAAQLRPETKPHKQPGQAGEPHHGSLSDALRFVLAASDGERNKSLYWASHRLAEAVASGLISDGEGRAMLYRAGTTIGLAAQEAKATINSAFAENGRA